MHHSEAHSSGDSGFTVDGSGLSFSDINQKVREAVESGKPVTIINVDQQFGLVTGLRTGEVTIKSDVGDYAGLLNSGGKIRIEGNAGDFVGDNSWGGEILVAKNAGYGAGMYCYGGTLVIRGNASDAAGQLLKGGTLIVNGDVGDLVGLYMVGGDIVILGNAGKNLGDYMVRGAIYLKGKYESLGHNAKIEKMNTEDLARLSSYLEKHELRADAKEFKKLVPISKSPFE